MVYAISTFSRQNGKTKGNVAKEKNAQSLAVAQRLLKYAMQYVTNDTPIQAYKAFLACHIALSLKLRQITPKDDNVLLNTCYYAYHGRADNITASGYTEQDILSLVDTFIPPFAQALALADKQDEQEQEQDELTPAESEYLSMYVNGDVKQAKLFAIKHGWDKKKVDRLQALLG